MKVVATAYQRQRLVLDEVDAVTASMTAQVLNDIRAHRYAEMDPIKPWWFYHAEPDTFEVKS